MVEGEGVASSLARPLMAGGVDLLCVGYDEGLFWLCVVSVPKAEFRRPRAAMPTGLLHSLGLGVNSSPAFSS